MLETLFNLSPKSQIKVFKVIQNFTSLGNFEEAIRNSLNKVV